MARKIYNELVRWARSVAPLCLFIFLPVTVSAQVGEHRSELAVGFSGGYMLSRVGFSPKVPQNMLGGVTAGVTVRYTCEKYYSSVCAIVGEVNFAQMGWNEKIQTVNEQPVLKEDGTALSYKRQMQYIQIPVFARLGWGRERRGLQGFFQVGPQLGLFLSETTNTNFTDGEATQNERASKVTAQESMPVERKFDYGIAGGAGIEWSFGRNHLMLEGRYYYGLGDIYGNAKADYFGRSNHNNIVIKVSYLFDLLRSNNSKIR